MKKMLCWIIMAINCNTGIATTNVVTDANAILNATGNKYRRLLNEADLIAVQKDMRQYKSSFESQVMVKIIADRISHPEVFYKLNKYIKSEHLQLVIASHRGGWLSGLLANTFAKKGPESKFVNVYAGRRNHRPAFEKVKKYTESEVKAGRARNRAARMALLEHILKFSAEDGGYVQRELVYTISNLWGNGTCSGSKSDEDGINGGKLLQFIAGDKRQPLTVRAAAIANLPEAKRVGERELMLEILNSPTIYDKMNHWVTYSQAVNYFKKHDPQVLKTIKPKIYWKRVILNKAQGLPAPPPEMKKRVDPAHDPQLDFG